ncbi:MAG: T9SS type A sorting domain-containing protein [Flavobacteriales bacterium]|nr:T9SS type A sorting domain-containing protein [Flavobacteriales bacterium]
MRQVVQIILLMSAFVGPIHGSAQSVTYNSDVACILFEHCTTCHHVGGIAPFSLMSYDDASAAAYGVMQSVNAGTMPPWPPNPDYNHLAHERMLTDEEIQTITEWVNAGTPEGNGLPPVQPVYSGDEEISSPDLVLTMPEYIVNTSGEDVFRCFVVPTSFPQDIYVTALEVVPGNRAAVHHVMIYYDETDLPQQFDEAEPGPGYTSFGSTNSEASVPVAGWGPGQGKRVFPDGMGVRIPAGASIVMQVHYPATSNGQTDQSKINMIYTTEPLREIQIHSFIDHFHLNEGTLTIPASEVRTFTGQYTLPLQQDITLLDVNIHMHLLGNNARTWAVLPNNETVPLMEIDHWNFHWQGFYDFRQPIRIPGGTVFHGEATYDNTSNNSDNPNNPPQTVSAGNDSDQEMMLILFSYVAYEPGDEQILVDTTTVHPEHNCMYVGVDDHLEEPPEIHLYPNPVRDRVYIQLPNAAPFDVSILDVAGREVLRRTNCVGNQLDVSRLGAGSYLLRIGQGERVGTQRFFKAE